MTSERFARSGRGRAVQAVALLLAGALSGACATGSPTASAASIGSADYAVRKAAEEELGDRSQVVLRGAEDKLEEARRLRDAGKHDQAERLADEAAMDAQLADAMAQNTVAHRYADEAARALRELEEEARRSAP